MKRALIREIKSKAHGDVSGKLANWDMLNVEWSGVQFNKSGDVIRMELRDVGLTTTVASALAPIFNGQRVSVDLADNPELHGDISELQGSDSAGLYDLRLPSTGVQGDIKALQSWPNLRFADFDRTKVQGKLAAIEKCTKLTHLNFRFTRVSGDIAALGKLPQLLTIDLYQIKSITGDIAAISCCKALRTLFLGHTEVYGSIDCFSDLVDMQVRATPPSRFTPLLAACDSHLYVCRS